MRTTALSAALCLAPPLLPLPAFAQERADSGVVLDFASQSVRGLPLHAGRAYTVTVVNFNPLCFSPAMRVDFTRSTFDTEAARALFRSAPQPTADVAPTIDIPATADLPGAPADTEIVGMIEHMTSAELRTVDTGTLLRRADADLQALDVYRRTANRILSTFENMDCTTGWNISALLREWQEARDAVLSARRNYEPVLARVRQYLAAASDQQAAQTEPYASVLRDLQAAASIMEATLKPLAARVDTVAPQLNAAVVNSTLVHQFDAGHDIQGVRLTVTGGAASEAPDVVRTFDLSMRVRHRIAFSTGIVATAAPSIHFDRVNRFTQPEEEGEEATVYSTFAETSGSDWDLVNPALFVSGSLFGLVEGANVFASFGTTLRGVNNQTTLEPLIGLGAGLIDRLFLQLGLHFGRAERLLISTPDGVAVPSEITRSDAVGTRWKAYFYSGFSIRIN